MTTPHYRRCWDCGAISSHSDNIAPEVCCKRCGSQDTRKIRSMPNVWLEWNQVSREIHNGDIWWHDNGEQIYPVTILWNPTTEKFFATLGQWGWSWAQDLSELGGRWMPCIEPEPDAAYRDSVRQYFQE